MSKVRALAMAAIMLGGLTALVTGPVKADVATRCDWRGCAHIVCNWTGNRCHRFYGDDYYRRDYNYPDYHRYGYDRERYHDDDDYYRRSDRYRAWHYDCDHDADDCYVHGSRDWNGDD